MSNYAQIQNGVAIEIVSPAAYNTFNPTTQALFVSCPSTVTVGYTYVAPSTWTAPPVPPPPVVKYPILTPMQFYLAFTPAERIAIKKSTDPDVQEFWATYEVAVQLGNTIDPNLVSVQEGLAWLATPTSATPPGPGILVSTARIAQISEGIPQ